MTYTAATRPTPLGTFMVIADRETVVRSSFGSDLEALRDWLPDPAAEIRVRADLGRITEALRAYFDGSDVLAIDALPVRAAGSPSMQRLWNALRRVPAGEVCSYAELGGERRFARAAGTACARNPIPVIVPCHRVIASDGGLGGFGFGLDAKRWLLDHEAAATGRSLDLTA